MRIEPPPDLETEADDLDGRAVTATCVERGGQQECGDRTDLPQRECVQHDGTGQLVP